MAELTLEIANLPTPKQMPTLCARCGRTASATRACRLKVYRPFPGPNILATLAGYSTVEQQNWHELLQTFAGGKGVIELPVCWWHRWIVPPFIGIKSMTEHRMTLRGLADGFVKAMKQRGWSRG